MSMTEANKSTLSKNEIHTLITKAIGMTKMSYVPYSHFTVGAALLCSDGTIFTGCNIENSAYGPTICAERTAIFKAVSEGHKDFTAIAIVGGLNGKLENFCMPCGVCRQVMSEFCKKDFIIISAKTVEEYKVYSLEEILPFNFKLD